MPLTVRPDVASLPAYQPGRPAPRGAVGAAYKLSSNENPFPPLPGVLAAVELACAQLNRYPDLSNSEVTAAVAAKLDLSAAQIAFGTGSVAVLYSLLQAVCRPGDEVVFAWRSFEAYPIAVQIAGAHAVAVPLGPGAVHDLAAMRRAITPATRAVLICTPNNPTGPAVPHDELVAFVDSIPDDVLIVVDEAYTEFVRDPAATRGLELLAGRDNVSVLRTFSKAYGLAGFRVGFCVAAEEVARAVRAVSLPFGVSVPAQAAVLASLQAEQQLFQRVDEIVAARRRLASGLVELGFDVPDSQANFVWLPAGARTTGYAEAFTAAGVTVRPYAAGDPGDGIRITVGEPEALDLVLETATSLPR